MKRILIAGLILSLLAEFAGWGCKKDLPDPGGNNNGGNTTDTIYFSVGGVSARNGEIKNVTQTSVTIQADFNRFVANTFTVIEHGHVISKAPDKAPTLNNNDGQSNLGAASSVGSFTSQITGLEPNTLYYYRVYIKEKDNASGIISEKYHPYPLTFSTLSGAEPVVRTNEATDLSAVAFTAHGVIADFKGVGVLNYGFVLSTTGTPTITQNEGIAEKGAQAVPQGNSSHTFNHNFTNLLPGKKYFLRSFATNNFGTGYGELKEITTLGGVIPVVVTDQVSDITVNSFTARGLISDFKAVPVVQHGFVYSLNGTPTLTQNLGKLELGDLPLSGSFRFNAGISNLQPNTKYNLRAYASNDFGVGYGAVVEVTTLPNPAPIISIASATYSEPNGSGNVNPGEKVTLRFTLTNTGNADGNGINLTIGSNNSLYAITTTQPVNYGTIVPGGQKFQEVEIEIPDDVVWGTLVRIPVTVRDDVGRVWDFSNGIEFSVISPFVVTSGLGFYLRFQECNGTITKSELGNYQGALFGAEFSTDRYPGTSGCSMEFSAQNKDYIQFASSPFYGYSNITLSFWLKSLSGNCHIMSNVSNNYNLKIQDYKFFSENLGFNLLDFNISRYLDNDWHHFVLVLNDQGKSKLYIDNNLWYEKTSSSLNPNSGSGLFIGRDYSQFSTYLDGKLDNFRIYNRALSAAEVEKIFENRQ